MIRSRGVRATAVLALLGATTGCAYDVFGPSAAGTYDLTWANGRFVPAVVYREATPGYWYTLEVTSGTLDLFHHGRFSLQVRMRETDGDLVTTWTQVYTGDWERDGRDVWLYYVDPVSDRELVLSGFLSGGYLEVPVTGILSGEAVLLGFER